MLWYERWLAAVLRQGHIPQHVAFIMDGNRRYARKCSVETLTGHRQGYDKLMQTLEWCLELGIKMVTVYAFSIENFKRPQDEVTGLMNMAKEKFIDMVSKLDIIEKHGVCVRVLGNLSLVPEDVREAMKRAVDASRHNTRVYLNICISYTSQQELSDAVNSIITGVQTGQLEISDISEELISRCFYTGTGPTIPSTIPSSPDLLIRTSGETRLSDFLVHQSTSSVLRFLTPYWPEFSFWQFGQVILEYQWYYKQFEAEQRERTRLRNEYETQRWKQYAYDSLNNEQASTKNERVTPSADQITQICDDVLASSIPCSPLSCAQQFSEQQLSARMELLQQQSHERTSKFIATYQSPAFV